MLKIIERTKLWFAISIIVIMTGMVALGMKGLNYGIDFQGGTVVTIEMGKSFNQQIKEEADTIIKKYDPQASTYISNETQIEIKSNSLTSDSINNMFKELKDKYKLEETSLLSQNNVGPSVGNELKKKTVNALLIATVAMLIYVGFRFEIKFGIAAILALIHDVLVTLGVYAIFQIPVNSPFIAAMLTIIGYSINDTIVIFDRIRENRRKMRGRDVVEIVNTSVTQTMSRSINTSLTTLVTIVAVYIFVPSVRDFAFPLIIGIISGAYSSIFVASPIWVLLKRNDKKAQA
ncbi:protein translocase subunit SecF [Clostridium bovifaecis]|uniref:Protein-export membrane protein SecF n=1 Tax=Clostridium bovifaecis TaxID=2184719 RepID=A0A6I6F310_9CLOT|nr:protein translocase subunit SecF [Clostridium bovifaecis]